MLGKKKKPNKRTRAAIRKAKIAAGVAPVKTPKKKKQVSVPEFAPVERQSPFAPRNAMYYVTGGGIVRPVLLNSGWQLSTDERPNPAEYRLAAMSCVPQPEFSVKLLLFVLRDEVIAEMRERADRVKRECLADDHAAVSRRERKLLIARNIAAGRPALVMRKSV
jgi:hypothetical protein